MKKLIVLFCVLLFFTGCADRSPEGPGETATPPGTAAAETPSPTPPPMPTPTATPAAARPDATTPVLVGGLLVGGLDHGLWTFYEEFYKSKAVDFDGFIYDVYVDGELIGQAEGELPESFLTGEPIDPEGDLSHLSDINLHDENGQNVEYDIAISADWDLFPREYAEQSEDTEEYQTLMEDLLTEEGLSDPVTALRQVVTVDLDGDGTGEVLISSDSTPDDQYDKPEKGDNALLVLRKLIDGQPADQIVASNIMVRDPISDFPYRDAYTVESCADLDGDGILEVVVKRSQYEGSIYSIYKLEGDRLNRVASNGAGV